jgi:hypothetical protein
MAACLRARAQRCPRPAVRGTLACRQAPPARTPAARRTSWAPARLHLATHDSTARAARTRASEQQRHMRASCVQARCVN